MDNRIISELFRGSDILDISEQDLLNSVQTEINLRSNGLLNDFSAASPLSVLTESFVVSTKEVIDYVNLLPDNLLLKWLELQFVERRNGRFATGVIEVTRDPLFQNVLTIPKGFRISDGGVIGFITDDVGIMPIGQDTLFINVTAERPGRIYNVDAGVINTIPVALAGVSSISNPQPMSGGSSKESDTSVINRSLNKLNRRNLVGPIDYWSELRKMLGYAPVIRITRNTESAEKGITLLVCQRSGDPINDLDRVRARIQSLVPLGVTVQVKSPVIVDVKLSVYLKNSENISNLISFSNKLQDDIRKIYSPRNVGIGEPLIHQYLINRSSFIDYGVFEVIDFPQAAVSEDLNVYSEEELYRISKVVILTNETEEIGYNYDLEY